MMNSPENQEVDTQETPLSEINLDQRAQPRDHLSIDKIAEYAEAMAAGDKFPAMVVFFDGSEHWLADGFHRHYAAQGAKLNSFPCKVIQGGLRDAILYSVGANATHGYPRTNADKRRSVIRLLEDTEWSAWSDREIARRCHVSDPFVGKVRDEIAPKATANISSEPEARTYRDKHGNTSTMKTGGINRDRQPSEPPAHSPTNMNSDTKALFDADTANSFIANRLWDIEKIIGAMPTPEDAARRFPTRHLHTFSASQARAIADWFEAFANEFETTRELKHVAAE